MDEESQRKGVDGSKGVQGIVDKLDNVDGQQWTVVGRKHIGYSMVEQANLTLLWEHGKIP